MNNTTSVFSLYFNSVDRLEINYHKTESWNNQFSSVDYWTQAARAASVSRSS